MRARTAIVSTILVALTVLQASAADKLPRSFGKGKMYHKGWTDFNKNGVKDVYEDPTADIDARIEDLLGQMTLEEKTCQMVTLYGYRRVLTDQLPTPEWKEKIWKDGVGAIDEHLNSFVGWNQPPSTESPYIWPASVHARALNEVQRFFIEETRLGIPVDFTNEGIRGVEAYKSTNFPTQLGLGNTWDRELIHEVGRITGREGRLLGYTNVYAPILDVGRDQRWGRYEEVYGEDPYLVAELGIQMVRGLQKDNQVAATAKHFCIYSAGKGAREGNARCDPHEAPHEVENIHMYPWRRVVGEAGLMGAMSSYNDYDGEPIEASHYWLYDRLRTDFGFRGYVVSDSDAVEFLHNKHHTSSSMKESVRQSVEAGLNVRCTFRSPDSYVLPLRELVREGSLSMSTIDERVRDILRVKFTVGLFDTPYQQEYDAADAEINGAENNKVSLRASQECLVLLKNNGLLPLDPSALKRVAVVGPNADDDGYAHVHYGPVATESVTVLGGLRKALEGKAEVVYTKGCEVVDSKWPDSELTGYEPTPGELKGIAEAVELCKGADVAVVVLGGNLRTCGENRSRTSIDLPGCQELLLREVKKTGKPVVLVLVNGRPLSINWADAHVDAILDAWYPGAHGGTAVAQALLGEYNPGGKLSVTFPKTVGQIPFNFPFKPNSQVSGYYGLGPDGRQTGAADALYDFGYGLSYTTFEYSNLRLSSKSIMPGEDVDVTFTLKNTGKYDGDEIVQLYLHDVESSITVYDRMLRGFDRVHLAAGESRDVTLNLPAAAFEMLDRDMKTVIEPGIFEIFIGASSTDLRLSAALTVKDPSNPGRRFVEDNALASVLPVTLSEGDEFLIPLDDKIDVRNIDILWRMDSKCVFSVSINEGGGQFLPILSRKSSRIDIAQKISIKPARRGSDIKIQILEGKGTITSISCEAIRK
ncbi:MAG: glycoside hydrolase family 3 C-terminal domain-containing protein [Bacteroidales bacterium]|nr:glycoside hydrolase family 3 C-terminal domain-containing protein [Bacteroidales bacterium]